MKTRRSRRRVAGSATRSAPNAANDNSIAFTKMLESLMTTPTTIYTTSSTSGETPAPSSSQSTKNARKPKRIAPPPILTSSTTTRSRHERGRTSGPMTRRLAYLDQPLHSNKVDELPSSRSALSDLTTITAPGILVASTRLTNAATFATLWGHDNKKKPYISDRN